MNTAPTTIANQALYASDSITELTYSQDSALTSHRHTIANRVATRLMGLESGSHIVRLCGVEYIVWVDHEQAHGDDGTPVPSHQFTRFDLRHVTGPNALLNCTPVHRAESSPYETGCDGNYLPLHHTAEQVAGRLVAHAARKAVN